jgi:hypothetical protein
MNYRFLLYPSAAHKKALDLAAVLIGVLLVIVSLGSRSFAQSCTQCPQWFIDQCHQAGYDYSIDSSGNCLCGDTPIIIDTRGTGIKLSSPSEGAIFDLLGNGNTRRYSWPESDSGNAFLALDRNGNGIVDDGKELFGNATSQPTSFSANGFAALAEFDRPVNGGNSDGRIDEHDSVFGSLRLWIDANRNGISETQELFTLTSMNIVSISLSYKLDQRRDKFGNVFRYRAAIQRSEKGNAGPFGWDIFLARDPNWKQ